MARGLPVLVAVMVVASGLAVAGGAMAHQREEVNPNNYDITDQGRLTARGGPVLGACRYDESGACGAAQGITGTIPGVHEPPDDPTTGERAFVPCGSQSVNTQAGEDPGHRHVGSCVTYSFSLDDTDNSVEAEVEYEHEDLNPHPIKNTWSADLDLYLYGPNGDIVPGTANEGPDGGRLTISEYNLPQGAYTVLLVARHGVAPYSTNIHIID